jgi:hypothetical protein
VAVEAGNVPQGAEAEEDIRCPCPVAEEGYRGCSPSRWEDQEREEDQKTWSWRRGLVVVPVLHRSVVEAVLAEQASESAKALQPLSIQN